MISATSGRSAAVIIALVSPWLRVEVVDPLVPTLRTTRTPSTTVVRDHRGPELRS